MIDYLRSDKKLNIWQISREMAPFAEAGGIKDVVSGLSAATCSFRHNVTVVLPLYQFLLSYGTGQPDIEFTLFFRDNSEAIRIFSTLHNSIRIFFVSAECYSSKKQVYTYSREEEKLNGDFTAGTGHRDSHLMNLVLQRSALEIALSLGEKPDIFHLHDGHTGFLPAIMQNNPKYKSHFSKTKCVLTIHNGGIVYQQNIINLKEAETLTELPDCILQNIHTEYGYSPLICAGLFGYINTVSEKYAQDILSCQDVNSGSLGAVLKEKKIELPGITNGIEISRYRKPLFPHILEPIIDDNIILWKNEYKSSLFKVLRTLLKEDYMYGTLIEDTSLPLITMQSRLTYQKGVDIFCESLGKLLAKNVSANFLILGEGEHIYEESLKKIALEKQNLCFIRNYDEVLSQYLFAAGDFFIIPSRWEPCGLTDFIAQIFGNIPIVHETGGLLKTRDLINGFSYKDNNSESLSLKIEQEIGLYQKNSQILHDIRKNAVNLINEKYTWEKVFINRYLPFYREVTGK